MTKFYIVERQACVVEWRFPVEAANHEEAFEKYGNGEHGEAEGPAVIGDSIEAFQYDLDIEDAYPDYDNQGNLKPGVDH